MGPAGALRRRAVVVVAAGSFLAACGSTVGGESQSPLTERGPHVVEATGDSQPVAKGSKQELTDESTEESGGEFAATLLDGSVMIILAGDGALSDFTDGVPSEIHKLNLLAEARSCDELLGARDVWSARVADTDEGRKASAFAQHAQNLAVYFGCTD